MSFVIVTQFEERNPGGPPSRPAGACAFSGCPHPYWRHARGRWPTCLLHSERIEHATMGPVPR